MTEVAFDDIDALREAVSDEFGPWGPKVKVTQEMVDQFAELTNDRQWIHVDVERSERESPFGGTIAHGFLTLSLLPALMTKPVSVSGHKSALNYGAERLRFLSPVPVGSSLHARSRLSGVEERKNGTMLTTEIEVSALGATKPALVYGMQVLYAAPTVTRPNA